MVKKKSSGIKWNGPVSRYLPCSAEPGMFRGELLVYLDAIDPEDRDRTIRVQMLVDHREVEHLGGEPRRNSPVSAWVRVTLANQEGGIAEVVLPQPAQPVGESMLVDVNQLRETPGP
jgi:hypothetical protein